MARYFGNFIDKLPFVESAYNNKQVVIPTGNLAGGFVYPLMGWAYNKEEFLGVYETELGLNCFQISPSDITKEGRRAQRNRERQLEDVIENAKRQKYYKLRELKDAGEIEEITDEDRELTDEETKECELTMIRNGNVNNLGYQGPKDLQRLQCELVSYETFKRAMGTADFGCVYINQKKVDTITSKNKEHLDKLVADYDILCQVGLIEMEERNRYYRDAGGLKTYSPLVLMLTHKQAPDVLFRAHSPDLFYKKPQLEVIQVLSRDTQPHSDLMSALMNNSINITYDDPINTLDSGYSSNNEVSYTLELGKSHPAENYVMQKALLTKLFACLTPSRMPVLAMRSASWHRRLEFLSRFKNGRMVGNILDMDSYKKFNSGIRGTDAGDLARKVVECADLGQLNSEKCIVLDDSVNLEEFVDECRVYTLTSDLGG